MGERRLEPELGGECAAALQVTKIGLNRPTSAQSDPDDMIIISSQFFRLTFDEEGWWW